MNMLINVLYSVYGIDKWGKDFIIVMDKGEVGFKNFFNFKVFVVSLFDIFVDFEDCGI